MSVYVTPLLSNVYRHSMGFTFIEKTFALLTDNDSEFQVDIHDSIRFQA